MVFNVLSSALAWLMAASMVSAVALAMAPVDPAPALVFSMDWRNVPGWVGGSLFAVFVYLRLTKKDRSSGTRGGSAHGSQ
jgi:TRAP-type C4-dicarboxylate transport system permease small subunit